MVIETGVTLDPNGDNPVVWYWAKPDGNALNWVDMTQWCGTTFGRFSRTESSRQIKWYYADGRFYFALDEDRLLFIIRWAK